MSADVGRPGPSRGARRPGPVLTVAVAALLLLGGGTALAVGLTGQDAVPPPLAVASATPSAAPAATPSAAPSGAPSTTAPTPAAEVVAPSSSAAATTVEVREPAAAPVTVRIPAIGVTSDLIHLGLAEDGTIAVPEGDDFDRAAWFDGSPRPGDVGPAVIEGHVSSRARGPSVFFELSTLTPGDTVEVDREDGTTATFEVYDLQQFPKDSFPTLAVYGNTVGPELRLITCGGDVSEADGHFTDNVVVFAREV